MHVGTKAKKPLGAYAVMMMMMITLIIIVVVGGIVVVGVGGVVDIEIDIDI